MARTKQTARKTSYGPPTKQLYAKRRTRVPSDTLVEAIHNWVQKGKTRAAKRMKGRGSDLQWCPGHHSLRPQGRECYTCRNG